MSDPATSLGHLHDIVLPAAVPWWPPAPGWYVLLALLVPVTAFVAWRAWKSWRANAYRRAALRELAGLGDAPAIAELLRRTALAVAPRPVVAARTGTHWTTWLDAQSTTAMSDAVRRSLSAGIYDRAPTDHEVEGLRDYAARWIEQHDRAPRRTVEPTS